jgi:hypothetical protein
MDPNGLSSGIGRVEDASKAVNHYRNNHYTLKTTLASIRKYRLYTEPPSFEERHYLLEARSPRAKRNLDASPYGTPTRKIIITTNGERVKSVRVAYEEHTRIGP